MKKLVLLAALATGLLITACTQAAPAAPTPPPPPPTATPPPMASKLILYGDLAWFIKRGEPDNCVLKNRFKPGEGVGFRMIAVDPLTGKYSETAELTVHISYAGGTEDIPMRARGPDYAQPYFHTARWTVPDDAATGVVKYTVTGKDKEGRTGEFKPFSIEDSQLEIVG